MVNPLKNTQNLIPRDGTSTIKYLSIMITSTIKYILNITRLYIHCKEYKYYEMVHPLYII